MEAQQARWSYVVTGVFIIAIAIAFARFAYGVVLPFMRDGLSITYQQAGFLGTATSFGYLCTVIFAGVASAKWGGKQSILLGLLVIFAGFVGLSLTPSYELGILFMCMLGIGTAFIFTSLVTILTGWFPTKKGLVIGYMNGGAGIGMLFVGLVVPYVNKLYPEIGWRLTWGSFAVVSVLVLVQTLFFMRNPPRLQAGGIKQKQSTSSSALKTVYLNRKVLLVGAIYGIVGLTYISQTIFIMSFMLKSGISPALAGQLITLNGILSVFSAPFWGGLSDKLGRRTALILAMGLNLIATVFPVLYPSVLSFACNSILIGSIGTGIFTLIQALSTEQVEPRDTPIAFSYVTFIYAFGQFIGPATSGWFIDNAGGFQSAFLFSSVCILIALVLTTRLQKQKQHTAGMDVRESGAK
ncbi:MAG: MFS transporter [Clostridia bacterium]